MSHLFTLIDKRNRGTISRENFRDVFMTLNLNLDTKELDKFIDNFWKDKEVGIDYPSFVRIFSKYSLKLEQEESRKRGTKKTAHVVSDETIARKKDIFDEINIAL